MQAQSVIGDIAIDAGTVQTEVEILKSPTISLGVIRALKLMQDPEFVGSGQDFFRTLLKFVPGLQDVNNSDKKLTDTELTNRVLASFESKRTVTRVGTTYMIDIGFLSLDPAKAATIANAIANAYVTVQLDAKYETTHRASVWLQERLAQLRTETLATDRAVVDFKRANNIVQSGNGLLMNEQQVSELNSQLILARAATAEAKARLDRINVVISQGIPDASVADALKSEVIIRMRNQYLDYAARERIFSDRYGGNHLATINLRTQMQEIRHNIDDEMRKIAASYKSDYEIASAREQGLMTSLANVVSESQSTNASQIKLRELESAAQSYRTIYDSFLQRYTESIQQQSFPLTESRVIGPAIVPTIKSQPKGVIVLAVASACGLMLSIAIAFYRELSDRVFRTEAQVEETLKTSCICTLPALKQTSPSARADTAADSVMAPRTITHYPAVLHHVVASPTSHFTEGLRLLQIVADLNVPTKSNCVIGVTSTLPNEGKSTIASNFAHLIAHAGERVVLIDCDLRNPSLTQRLAPKASLGLVHLIAGTTEFADAVWVEPSTGLNFVPAGAQAKLLHTHKIIGSIAAKHFFDRLRESFDYVIVDLPPLAPVVDTRATSNFIDSYIYVIEWARTNRHLAQDALMKAPEIYDRLLGVVMNRADMSVMSRYAGDISRYSYRKRYARYGYVES